jgi:hypothetical protein
MNSVLGWRSPCKFQARSYQKAGRDQQRFPAQADPNRKRVRLGGDFVSPILENRTGGLLPLVPAVSL